jgi:hypothetical protein
VYSYSGEVTTTTTAAAAAAAESIGCGGDVRGDAVSQRRGDNCTIVEIEEG